VRGDGVVGEQPMIEPGGAYDYVSGCPLQTPTGAMEGTFQMVTADGRAFDAAIPRFPWWRLRSRGEADASAAERAARARRGRAASELHARGR
jgi:hypothetical protein